MKSKRQQQHQQEIEILSNIVRHNGSCDWSTPETCMLCPMSRLVKRPSTKHAQQEGSKEEEEQTSWLSCVDALNIKGLTPEQADSRYKEEALRLLLLYIMSRPKEKEEEARPIPEEGPTT